MKYAVTLQGLRAENSIIPWDVAENLSGKNITRLKDTRLFKTVHGERNKGHLRLFDEQLIPKEKYKRGRTMWECKYIDSSGNAMMVSMNKKLKMVSSRNPKDWEIVL